MDKKKKKSGLREKKTCHIYNHVRTYTYDDNWNIMCVDKQNNVYLRQLVTYRKNNVCFRYILIPVIVMCAYPI